MSRRLRTPFVRWLGPLAMSCVLARTAMAEVIPKIVLQIGHDRPVVATFWSPDIRFVFSIAQDGSLIVWRAVDGLILDRSQLPLGPGQAPMER